MDLAELDTQVMKDPALRKTRKRTLSDPYERADYPRKLSPRMSFNLNQNQGQGREPGNNGPSNPPPANVMNLDLSSDTRAHLNALMVQPTNPEESIAALAALDNLKKDIREEANRDRAEISKEIKRLKDDLKKD